MFEPFEEIRNNIGLKLLKQTGPNENPYCWKCGMKTDDEDDANIIWVQCSVDLCKRWYHKSCLNLAVVPDENEPYYCLLCNENDQQRF